MIRLKNILVPVDFSEPSRTAVKYGLSLALEFDARLVLAHIAPYDEAAYERAKADLLELIPAGSREALHFEIIVKSGDVHSELQAIVLERHVDLVIMGSHGRGLVGRMVLGSVTEEMLRQVPVPIVTVSHVPAEKVPHKAGLPIHRILYASDLSDNSRAGLKFSIRLARGLDALLTVVHVIQPVNPAFMGECTVGYMPEYSQDLRVEAEKLLSQMVAAESGGRVPITTMLGEGEPYREINRLARNCKADLIVINLLRKGIIERALLGSTAERVVRTATLPVLCLPLPAAQGSAGAAA